MLKGAQICRALRIPLSDAQGSSDLQSPHQNPSEPFTRILHQNPSESHSQMLKGDLQRPHHSQMLKGDLQSPQNPTLRCSKDKGQRSSDLQSPHQILSEPSEPFTRTLQNPSEPFRKGLRKRLQEPFRTLQKERKKERMKELHNPQKERKKERKN